MLTIFRSYKEVPRAAFLPALAHLNLEFSNNFMPILYPLLIPALGMSYSQVGSISLVALVSATIAQPFFGWLSDRWQPNLIIVISLVWISCIMGLAGFAGSYPILMLTVALGALGSAAFHPPGAAQAALHCGERRGSAMAVFSVSGNLGVALSPFIIGFLVARVGPRASAIIIPVGLSVAFLLYLQFRRTAIRQKNGQEKIPEKVVSKSRSAWNLLVMVILLVAARSWVQGTVYTYLPEWLQTNGYSLETAGSLLSLLLVSVSLGSFTGGPVSDRVGRIPVVLTTLFLLGPAVWLILHAPVWGLPFVLIFTGLCLGGSFPVAILMAQDALPNSTALASALVMGIGWMPAGLGSFVIGTIADRTDLTSALTTLTVIPLVGVLAGLIYAFMERKQAA